MSLRTNIISGIKWSSAGTIFIAITAVLKISILARVLDKSDFGLMAMVTFVLGFMDLFNEMGLTSAILHKKNISDREYSSLYWFNLVISICLYGLLLLVVPLIADFYEEPQLKILIPLLGLNLIISGLGRIFKTIDHKHLKFRTVAWFEMIAAMFSLIFAIYFAYNNYGVYSLIYSALIQYSLSNLFFLVYGLHTYGLKLHYRYLEVKPFLKIGIYQVGGQLVNYFNRDIDILLVGKFFSPEVLGGYNLAKQLVMRPMQILNPIVTKVASPTLAKFQDSIQELKKNYLKLLSIIAAINIPVYIALIVFAPLAVEILYGSGFEDITILVRILGFYMLIRAINSPIGSLVIATGRTDLEFYWNILTLILTPIFVIIGVSFGTIGVALAMMGSMILLIYPAWRLLIFKMTEITFKEYLSALIVFNVQHLRLK
ncbi:MOP flippase family protein [Leeuwenhoekiella sp. H156]|uniref:MOP flippase family protein n=1 Tax=Leeuwenhoekiella sp. H156 TaxID=3450128 RepID=UPI003FA495C2